MTASDPVGAAPGQGPSRRAFLGGVGALGAVGAVAAVGGLAAACTDDSDDTSPDRASPSPAAPAASPVSASGPHQAGIVDPDPPQPNLLLAVFAVVGEEPGPLLADLGRAVLSLAGGADPGLAGVPPGDLTITVGIGPRLIALANPVLGGGGLEGAGTIPPVGREQIDPPARDGDLAIQVCASDALLLPMAMSAMIAAATGRIAESWRQRAARGPYIPVTGAAGATDTASADGGNGTPAQAPRNVFGFVDGISVPRTADEFAADVWIGSGPLAGGTVLAIRRMEADLAAFTALPVAAQEAVFGRKRADSAPLSGGIAGTDPDLGAKTPDGRYLIPATAHLRLAHPAPLGVPLMLRRSYSMDDPAAGLLFLSFQSQLSTFVKTLQRMDAGQDALLAFTTTTASGSFAILPGFTADRPLGSTLFG